MILFEFFGHFHNVENMFQEIAEKQTPSGEIHKGRVLSLSMSTEDSHLSQRRRDLEKVRTDERLQPRNDHTTDQIDRESMANAIEG